MFYSRPNRSIMARFEFPVFTVADLTSIRNQIKDLDGRSAALRGYL